MGQPSKKELLEEEERRSLNEKFEELLRKYPGKADSSTPPPPESQDRTEAANEKRRMDEIFDDYIKMEQKKGPLSDEKWNFICDDLSRRLEYDFSYRKITANTKMYRDALIRAKSVKEEVSIERPKPHALQRLYFSAFAPSALEVMVKNKVRPACCSIYSFLTLNCIYASGIAKASKHEILEKLQLSHKNAPSYFKELEQTGLVVDKDHHRSRKEVTRFYLPHTHERAKQIAKDEVNRDIFGGGDWVLMTPEAVEILTKATNERKVRGTHWYIYAHICLNTYRETGVTMRKLSKACVMKDLHLKVRRLTVYNVFKTLEELKLIIPEEHKKDMYFLPRILRKFAELALKNGTN